MALAGAAWVAEARAGIWIDVTETSPNTFSITLTTDGVFHSLVVGVNGNVVDGVNVVPLDEQIGTRQLVSTSSGFRLLSPLGNPEADGVFEPGVTHDIDLTYGVTSPVPGEWMDGLESVPFLEFRLLGGMAEASAQLFYQGETIESMTVAVNRTTLAGDFDQDGDVDGNDFLVWQWNPSVGNLAEWQNNYGTPPLVGTSAAVPEPSTRLLLSLAIVVGGNFKRRRRIAE